MRNDDSQDRDLGLTEAAERWQLTVEGVRSRARALGVTLTDVWPADLVWLGDRYQQQMQDLLNGKHNTNRFMLNTITAIKKRHPGHWFEPGALRFFDSKFPRRAVYPVRDGAFFISRERSKGVYVSTGWIPDGPLRWSVRFISDEDGSIDTVSEFMEYETLEAARAAARAFQKAYKAKS